MRTFFTAAVSDGLCKQWRVDGRHRTPTYLRIGVKIRCGISGYISFIKRLSGSVKILAVSFVSLRRMRPYGIIINEFFGRNYL